jgi:drug/metabolite transporter (DMT)-like permease
MKIKHTTSKAKGYMALAITSIVWGTTWIASKKAVAEIPALQMASIRQLIAGIIFIIFFMGYKKMPLPNVKQLAWIALLGLLMFVFANGLSVWSLNYIPAGLSALIGALYPLSVVLMEMIFLKKKNGSVITFIGLFLGIMGIVIVFYENAFHQHPPGFLFGVSLSVSAMLGWSTGTILIAKNKLKMNPYYAIGWQMAIAGILLLIFAKSTKPLMAIQDISLQVWLLIGYLVVAGSIISFVAFVYSVRVLPTAVASLYAYINPLVAMVLAPIFIPDEKLTIFILWGAIVTLSGVFLVNFSIRRNNKKIITEPEQ